MNSRETENVWGKIIELTIELIFQIAHTVLIVYGLYLAITNQIDAFLYALIVLTYLVNNSNIRHLKNEQ